MQSSTPVNALKNLNAFTLTGWLNCRSNVAGSGGNRIVSWINNGGEGVDLVYQSNGSLRLGVDGWPDSSPAFSSANKVPANAVAPPSNWVFFAVTYQSNGQVQFYFGNNTADATLDVVKSYPGRGATGSNIGKLAIGAFNDATRNASTYDRMFRGLIDNVKVFGSAISLSEIIAIQRNLPFDNIPPTAPQNLRVTGKTPTSVSLEWDGSFDNTGVTGYNVYQEDTLYLTANAFTTGTLTGLNPSFTYNFSLKARDAANNLSPASNTVTVMTDTSLVPLVYIKFSETGAVEDNYGSLGGQFAGGTGRSSNVPVSGSPFSTTSQITSGVPLDGLKNLGKFTITGWINKTTTSGANSIIGWQPANGGQGAELMVSSDGTLSLGVNQRPDFGTFSSANKISIDPNASASNWVFFAVTYDDFGHTKFYFGSNIVDATLDLDRLYIGQGPTGTDIRFMYITPEGAGLLDEIRVFGSILSLQDIIAVQGTLADTTPPTPPAGLNVTSVGTTSVGLNWTTASTDNIGIVSYDVFNGPTLLKVHAPQPSLPSSFHNTTVTGLTPGTSYTLTLKAKDGKGNYSPASNAVVANTSGKLPGTPLIWLKLDEPDPSSPPINSGTASANFNRSITLNSIWPISVTNVPVNVGGTYAIDYGTLPRNAYIESEAQIDGLRNMEAFTLTGWINNASNATGSGGNRIISWINHGGDGVDLVYQSDGSLRLGVDAWPDNSPAFSSPNKVTTNAAVPASNWVFFAVTYRSNGQVQFYFGNNPADATLDVTRAYSAPGVTGSAIGKLAIGAFNDATRNASTYDRIFRGLIDNIQIYDVALTAEEIVTIQRVHPQASPLHA